MVSFLSKWLIIWLIGRKLGKKKQRFRLWRQKFLSGLNSIGLDVEEVRTQSQSQLQIHKYTNTLIHKYTNHKYKYTDNDKDEDKQDDKFLIWLFSVGLYVNFIINIGLRRLGLAAARFQSVTRTCQKGLITFLLLYHEK